MNNLPVKKNGGLTFNTGLSVDNDSENMVVSRVRQGSLYRGQMNGKTQGRNK